MAMQAEVILQGQPRELPPEWETNLLRIGQEVLTNAIRHAEASKFDALLDFGSHEAGNQNVKGLVYVAAFGPGAGEDLDGLRGRFSPAALGAAVVPDSAGFLFIDRAKFQSVFANDLPEEEASLLAATQKPLAACIFGEPIKAAAWKNIPSWYVVSTQDNSINPELQRFMAKRMGARIKEIKASHVSFISNPSEIARVIESAAASVG